jgi:hypothetical protein
MGNCTSLIQEAKLSSQYFHFQPFYITSPLHSGKLPEPMNTTRIFKSFLCSGDKFPEIPAGLPEKEITAAENPLRGGNPQHF